MCAYKQVGEDGFTVGELMEILKEADPDALILIGNNPDDCEEYLYEVGIGKYLVGFFTERTDSGSSSY